MAFLCRRTMTSYAIPRAAYFFKTPLVDAAHTNEGVFHFKGVFKIY
jgi:hypothetical protein